MKRGSPRTVTTRHLSEWASLAKKGLSRTEIARRTGWTHNTIKRHVGHLVPIVPNGQGQRKPDIDRYRRMLAAVQGASYGELDGIARRFGLKNAQCLSVVLVTARRRVAEADSGIPAFGEQLRPASGDPATGRAFNPNFRTSGEAR